MKLSLLLAITLFLGQSLMVNIVSAEEVPPPAADVDTPHMRNQLYS